MCGGSVDLGCKRKTGADIKASREIVRGNSTNYSVGGTAQHEIWDACHGSLCRVLSFLKRQPSKPAEFRDAIFLPLESARTERTGGRE